MSMVRQVSDALASLLRGEIPERLSVPPGNKTDDLSLLAETSNALIQTFAEANDFVSALSQGILDVEPPRRNHLVGSFKQLHANLRHLTWQTQQVAAGDLSQQVDFLGDFSAAFNSMIESLRDKRRLEEALKQSHEELHEANSRIMDSILYAGSIQQAILPPPELLHAHLKDHFVLWLPRDIIGGDVYWFGARDNEFGLAVMDCTGHGVPGAIMTMIAVTALSRAADQCGYADPALILEHTNRLVKSTLSRRAADSLYDDGLEIGMCSVNTLSKTLTYAGARMSLFIEENGEVSEVKSDRESIGYQSSDPDHRFKNHHVDIDRPKSFYLTTDGLIDQIGGDKRFSFGRKRFKGFIRDNHFKPFGEQERVLRDLFAGYRVGEITRDDITVMGFRV